MADIVTPTRSEIISDYERDYLNRCPTALTGPGTQPRLLSTLLADQLAPVYANTIRAARASDLEQMTLEELRTEADRLGVVLTGASQSSGQVTIVAATAGTTIFAGDELTEPNSKAKFECLTTALYLNGANVSIISVSTGPETNLAGGTVLQWSTPRPGCGTSCTVYTDSNGNGLTGGANEEGREDIIAKIQEQRSNPPGAGNDADLRKWAKETPGVQIEEFFTYPAAYGPGTVAWAFTVCPDTTGSRTPTALQAALVRQQLAAKSPRSDLLFYVSIFGLPTYIVAQVTWEQDAVGWSDETPWPAYFPAAPLAGSGAIWISAAPSALAFTLQTSNADYTTCGDPVPGQTLAVWDVAEQVMRRKKILTVVGAGPWNITCDGTLDASDTIYTPAVGQRVMPWSDSLELLIPPLLAHFANIGPGEVKAATYLDGIRTRRDPSTPRYWPAQITKALEANMEAVSAVSSLDLTEGEGVVAAVHIPPYLLTLQEFTVFPA